MYDRVAGLPGVEKVMVAPPLKTRLIAEAQLKSEKIDAPPLATLLRGNLLCRVHVPAVAVRQRKDQLQQRLYFARLRTAVRNRIRALLDQQERLELPQCRDLFGVKKPHFPASHLIIEIKSSSLSLTIPVLSYAVTVSTAYTLEPCLTKHVK